MTNNVGGKPRPTRPVRLDLPEDTHAELRILAGQAGVPMSQYAREMLEDALQAGQPLTVTKEALSRLPHCGLAAWTARCADRVRHLVKEEGASLLVRTAVQAAYKFAGGGPAPEFTNDSHALLEVALRASAALDMAASCAADAALASLYVASHAVASDPERLVQRRAADAANSALYAATTSAGPACYQALRAAIRRDLDCLRHRTREEHLGDDSPVSPDFFGPLWPDGAPGRWSDEPGVTDGTAARRRTAKL
jgi:hypothetical protein